MLLVAEIWIPLPLCPGGVACIFIHIMRGDVHYFKELGHLGVFPGRYLVRITRLIPSPENKKTVIFLFRRGIPSEARFDPFGPPDNIIPGYRNPDI